MLVRSERVLLSLPRCCADAHQRYTDLEDVAKIVVELEVQITGLNSTFESSMWVLYDARGQRDVKVVDLSSEDLLTTFRLHSSLSSSRVWVVLDPLDDRDA